MINGTNIAEGYRNQVLEDCLKDPVLFCQTFLWDHFYRPIPWVHRGLMAVLTERTQFLPKYGDLGKIMRNFVHHYEDGETPNRQIFHAFINGKEVSSEEITKLEVTPALSHNPLSQVEVKLDLGEFTLLLMPRGSSKTTIAGFAIPIYKILYQMERFSLYVSKAQALTEAQLESIRKELSTNEVILEFFGSVKPSRSSDERWAKEKFETSTGVAMQARGKGSAIRGIHHGNKRPSTILVDDPQSRDDVKSDTIREDDKKWAFAELTPARARIKGQRGKIIVLGTWLHQECLVAVWSRDPRFTTVKIGVTDLDGEYIWPDYMDDKEYHIEKASFVRAGLLSQFYMEYHNKEMDESALPFPQRFIIYEPPPKLEDMVCATCFDPASGKQRTADFSAIGTVGIEIKTGKTWVLDMWLKRGAEDEEKIEEFFRQSATWKSQLHGVESNAGQAAYGSLIRREMFQRQHYFELENITHKTRKIDRIRAALPPRYAGGYFRHRLKWTEHELQLLSFRYDDSHMHDDGPDVQAMCMVLLDPTAAFDAARDPGITQFFDEGEQGYDPDYDPEFEIDYEATEWAS